MIRSNRWLALVVLVTLPGALAAAPSTAGTAGACAVERAPEEGTPALPETVDRSPDSGAPVPDGAAADAAPAPLFTAGCPDHPSCDALDGTPCDPPTPNTRCSQGGTFCGICACLSVGFWTCTQ